MKNHNHTHSHSHDGEHGQSHEHNHEHCHGHCHSHEHNHGEQSSRPATLAGKINLFIRTFSRELLSGLLLIAGVIMAHYGIFRDLSGDASFDWVSLLWYIVAVAPVAIVVIADAVKEWARADFMNEFTLMLVACVGAFCIGEYPEAVAVLLFYSFGEKMEDMASGDVRDRIRRLIGRLPEKAYVKDADGRLKEMNPADVAPGTTIVVRPGERVPIDGRLQNEEDIEFDTSAITGESVPRGYSSGEDVLSGMIPLDRSATLITDKAFADSSMSRMLKLIENAAAGKSPTESMLRRITRFYTPIVMVLAVLVILVPWIVSQFPGAAPFEFSLWFRRALVFLVCSCPCALVVSIPLSYFASMGAASRLGLLFKDSAHIDKMRSVDTVVFDKTGTLTTGTFHVVNVSTSEGTSKEEVLALAAAADADSAHPLAKAIVAAAGEIKPAEVSDVRTINHGVAAEFSGKEVLVGSRKLMSTNGIDVPESSEPYSEVCVALGGRYIGSIYLEDTLKPEARAAIEALHKVGIKEVKILSGDLEAAVARAAKAAGADSWESQLLPEDKQRIINSLRSKGKRVAFAGDGINDAPAIAASDVGIAMGTHGTDMAMESADVVIAGDNLSTIAAAVRLSKKVRRVIIENVVFALGVKAAVMILGAFGIATLWAAVFADTGVTAITIIWTLICLMRI